MSKDLRTFLGEVRQLGPEFIVSVSKPVDPVFEPCVIQQKLLAEGKTPVVRFENVNGSELPLTTNLFGSYELLGLALGVDPGTPKSEILDRFRERVQKPRTPVEIAREDALTIITIDRQDKANSLTGEMLSDLAEAFENAKDSRAIILTGRGKVFSAGADLEEARAGLATSPLWERLSGAVAAAPGLTIAALRFAK